MEPTLLHQWLALNSEKISLQGTVAPYSHPTTSHPTTSHQSEAHQAQHRIVTDSRAVQAGDVFWGIRGDHHNGGMFAKQAYQHGAIGVIVENEIVKELSLAPPNGCWLAEVPDALQALRSYVSNVRKQFTGELIGITGSVGKTTTKTMLHSILQTQLSGTASPHNWNNQFGVPFSMLSLSASHDYGIIELGANAIGEIQDLAKLSQPTMGILTSIGDAHLGTFGSLEKLQAEKTELLKALPGTGVAFLNRDDRNVVKAAQHCSAQKIWFGRSSAADVVATNVQSKDGVLRFCVNQEEYEIRCWGRQALVSALAAIAVSKHLGISTANIATGLQNWQATPLRCEVKQIGTWTILNDCYNASPQATRAAVELLRDYNSVGRKVIICGDMGDLGEFATEEHFKIGEMIARLCSPDLLITCGKHAATMKSGAMRAGLSSDRIHQVKTTEDVLKLVPDCLKSNDVILVKGARWMRLERVAEKLALFLG